VGDPGRLPEAAITHQTSLKTLQVEYLKQENDTCEMYNCCIAESNGCCWFAPFKGAENNPDEVELKSPYKMTKKEK
jgi:hypothetical protein